MARGRNRKAGKRTKSGQLSRAGQCRFDRGSDKAADKFSIYGTDGSDALGRAFVHGLLGDDGIVLRDTGRAVARAYWPMLCVGPIGCTLGTKTGEGGEGNKAREDWLLEIRRKIDAMGHDKKVAFDQLAINWHVDEGPPWLDRMIDETERFRIALLKWRDNPEDKKEPELQYLRHDKQKLDMAIEVLRALAA